MIFNFTEKIKIFIDTRVHCCLYFIPPYGHGLRQIDLEFLRRLQYKVNLIPVIAKADTLTAEEVKRLKDNINKEIEENDIEIYQFPDCDSGTFNFFKNIFSSIQTFCIKKFLKT